MFSGIIKKTGVVKKIIFKKNEIQIGIKSSLKLSNKDLGSSINCSGVCLTVEKFNKKYSKLSTEQKEVLRKYINNVSNATSLREFVQVEVGKIKSYLKKLVPAIDDDITKIKLTEAINFADTISENKDTEKKLTTLLRYYDLITELEDVLDRK